MITLIYAYVTPRLQIYHESHLRDEPRKKLYLKPIQQSAYDEYDYQGLDDTTYNIIATGFPGRIYPTTNSVITLCHQHESKYHQPPSTHPNVINEINQ